MRARRYRRVLADTPSDLCQDSIHWTPILRIAPNLLIFLSRSGQTERADANNRRACRSMVCLTQNLRIRTRNSSLLCGPRAHDRANWNVRSEYLEQVATDGMERSQVRIQRRTYNRLGANRCGARRCITTGILGQLFLENDKARNGLKASSCENFL